MAPHLSLLVLLLVGVSSAAPTDKIKKAYISTAAEYNTECKTSPHVLSPNTLAYYYGDALNVTCWTRGTRIMGDSLWLKSESGCYVTEYDLLEYSGSFQDDLPYCGRDSEDENLTTEFATLQYKSECRICPDLECDVISYLAEETDLTLTCWSDKGQIVIDDPYWHKTTNNCYVAEKSLYSKPDITYLDYCGPIPFLEELWHFNENGTSEVDKRSPAPLPEPMPEGGSSKYLINVTIGNDNARCRECPKVECDVVTTYQFNQEVWTQCLAEVNGTWWSETTDFCYVNDADFWQDPAGDYYRNPLCDYFGDDNNLSSE